MDARLREDVAEKGFDGLLADEELLSVLGVRQALHARERALCLATA